MLDIKPRRRKVHSLTGRITPKVMEKAWKAVRKNRGAAGVDRVSIDHFNKNLEENLETLMKDLKTRGALRCPPLKRVYIPKAGSNKKRPLGIPTVSTRIAQEVVRQLIEPMFEKQFHDDSFGFRPKRGCHQAIERAQQYIKEGYKFVVDADIKGFFDNISHELIMDLLRAEIADGNILDILEKFLKSGVMEDGQRKPTIKGTPQGGVISPLLSNIVLNHLDWQLASRGYKFVRYADDFVILCKSMSEAESALDFVQSVLKDLGLELSPEKTHVDRVSKGFQFLGFLITGIKATIRKKSKEKLETTIKELTRRSSNLDAEVITKLNRVLRGTVNYFCKSYTQTLHYFSQLDQWIRSRIRAMKFKRKWHTDNRRLKNKHIEKYGLLSCRELCLQAKARFR